MFGNFEKKCANIKTIYRASVESEIIEFLIYVITTIKCRGLHAILMMPQNKVLRD